MDRKSSPKSKRKKSVSLSPAAHTVLQISHATLLPFPVEILLYMISFIPNVAALDLDYLNREFLPPDYFVRSDVLRALSQTCRRLVAGYEIYSYLSSGNAWMHVLRVAASCIDSLQQTIRPFWRKDVADSWRTKNWRHL